MLGPAYPCFLTPDMWNGVKNPKVRLSFVVQPASWSIAAGQMVQYIFVKICNLLCPVGKDNSVLFRKQLEENERFPTKILRRLNFDKAQINRMANLRSEFFPARRRYTQDGKKICRCGSRTHKNTLHRYVHYVLYMIKANSSVPT